MSDAHSLPPPPAPRPPPHSPPHLIRRTGLCVTYSSSSFSLPISSASDPPPCSRARIFPPLLAHFHNLLQQPQRLRLLPSTLFLLILPFLPLTLAWSISPASPLAPCTIPPPQTSQCAPPLWHYLREKDNCRCGRYQSCWSGFWEGIASGRRIFFLEERWPVAESGSGCGSGDGGKENLNISPLPHPRSCWTCPCS